MPRTPTMDEVAAFFSGAANGGVPEAELQPKDFPGSLYEHMVKKAAPFAVRGILWYQGESDQDYGLASIYDKMLTGLISDWRSLWNEDLPFLIVQLPGFESWLNVTNTEYHILRQRQEKVCKEIQNVWLCSISDIGEQFDIHPKNKLPVGKRLALLAKKHIYGEQILCDAPALKTAGIEEGKIHLFFENAEGGLKLMGEKVNALEVLVDRKSMDYEFEIRGETVVLTVHGLIQGSVHIRFATQQFYQVNLYNQMGIPAVPFEVDISV